jgi:hypothetical protein
MSKLRSSVAETDGTAQQATKRSNAGETVKSKLAFVAQQPRFNADDCSEIFDRYWAEADTQ